MLALAMNVIRSGPGPLPTTPAGARPPPPPGGPPLPRPPRPPGT